MINKNLLDKINAQLSEYVPPFPLDGKFHHFKNGKKEDSSSHVWAIGYEWEYKGNMYSMVKFGDWRDGSTREVRSYDPKNESKPARKAADEQIKKIEEEAKNQKELKHKECKEKWEKIWSELHVNSGVHEYLQKKHIKSNYRSRIRENTLVIPIEHPEHGFVGVQQIFKQDNSFKKVFSKGTRIKSSYTRLTDFNIANVDTIYITEGFATGCSVYEAIKKPVIVCFFASNIIPVIANIKKINSSARIVIAGDNDHANRKNPGRYYASLAAKQFSNVVYKLPTFENPDGLSDFNDLHVCESIEKVRDQLTFSQSDFINIIPLGHNYGDYYYVNTQTSEIFNLRPPEHNKANFIAQANSRYWGQKYGFKKDREGNPTPVPNWDIVAESLLEEQRLVGFFNHENVRGYGCWYDNGNIVFNAGKSLIINNKVYPITEHNLQTRYVYEADESLKFDHTETLSENEREELIRCFSLISCKNANDYIYLLGFVSLAQIAGISPWRSHLWLTAARGTGKTTIMSWLSQLCYGQGTIQDPTQAGLRQTLKHNSLPIFMDETEPNNPEARRRLDSNMDLIRQSSSPNSSRIVRGTTDGRAQSFSVSGIFCLSSIQVSIKNAADISRFTVIELAKNTRENYQEMKKIAAHFEKWQPKLLAYMIQQAQYFRDNFNIIHNYILDNYQDIDSRQADQISGLVAGFYAIKHGGAVDQFKLSVILTQLNITNSQYIQDNAESDENECLSAVLSVMGIERKSIAYMIAHHEKDVFQDDLNHLGVKVLSKVRDNEYSVFFSSKSRNLENALRHTEFQDYSKILKRNAQCVIPRKTTRINGVTRRGIVMHLNLNDLSNEFYSQTNSIDSQSFDSTEVPF